MQDLKCPFCERDLEAAAQELIRAGMPWNTPFRCPKCQAVAVLTYKHGTSNAITAAMVEFHVSPSALFQTIGPVDYPDQDEGTPGDPVYLLVWPPKSGK